MPVELPIDHLPELCLNKFAARASVRWFIGFGFSKLEHASQVLERHSGDLFRLAAFFGPQHGFSARRRTTWWNGRVTSIGVCTSRSTVFTGGPSRTYGRNAGSLDVLLVDLQDVGRVTTLCLDAVSLHACLREMRHRSRCVGSANPINGVTTEGPVLDRL